MQAAAAEQHPGQSSGESTFAVQQVASLRHGKLRHSAPASHFADREHTSGASCLPA